MEQTKKKEERLSQARASFVVEIKCCQNSTWQGTVSWIETKKKQPFRSALELIKLMDSALESQKSMEKVESDCEDGSEDL